MAKEIAKIAMAMEDDRKVEILLKAVQALPLSATTLKVKDFPEQECVVLTLELSGEAERNESVTILYKTIYGLSSNIEIDSFVTNKQSYLLNLIIYEMARPESMDNR